MERILSVEVPWNIKVQAAKAIQIEQDYLKVGFTSAFIIYFKMSSVAAVMWCWQAEKVDRNYEPDLLLKHNITIYLR